MLKWAAESSLRSEFLVGEIVEIHKSSRQALLDILKEYPKTNSKGDSPLIELGSQSDADDDIQILATTDRKSSRPSTIGSSVNRVTKRTGVRSLLKNHNESNKSKQHMAQCPICEQFYPIEALERTHLDECLTVQSLEAKQVPRHPKERRLHQYRESQVRPKQFTISTMKIMTLPRTSRDISIRPIVATDKDYQK